MTTFNLDNLNELADQSEILKACMDAADRELASYGEALEAAVTFLVLENKDLRAANAIVNKYNCTIWWELEDLKATVATLKAANDTLWRRADHLSRCIRPCDYIPQPRPANMPIPDNPRK